MPAPRLTWNPDESKQALEVAAALDAAAKDATRRERARIESLIAHFEPISRGIDDRLLAAIRSGEPAPPCCTVRG